MESYVGLFMVVPPPWRCMWLTGTMINACEWRSRHATRVYPCYRWFLFGLHWLWYVQFDAL